MKQTIDRKYGSHLPLLTAIMDVTHGPVLELGMGMYSSPLLDMMCNVQDRRLWSFDSDKEWFGVNEKLKNGNKHEVIFVNSWDDFNSKIVDDMIEMNGGKVFSVAFVDEKPAKHRKESIKLLANKAIFVVVHDTEPESDRFFKYSWVEKLFKYRYDYTKMKPHTSIFSNFVDPHSILRA